MPSMVLLLLALALQSAPGAAEAPASRSNAALMKEAREAYDRGDKKAFLATYEELARRRPGEVFTLYNLACGQALNGQGPAAVRTLEEILAHRAASNLDADTDFDSIRQTEGYKRVVAGMNALRKERISSGAARAFTIPEKGFVDEGVAYDAITRAFFVSSVRHRRIVRISRDGRITDFVEAGRDGSALGMRIDPKRRTLWVATETIPAAILEMNHPDFDEPTLGVVADGALYFSADSQGQKFLDAKRPIGPEEMREAVILKLPLSPAGPGP